MNSTELTALHTETLNAVRIARTLTNISRRAASLLSDGYTVRAYQGTSFYEVTSPKGDKYSVWHGAIVGYTCNCLCFAQYNTCKHLEGVDLMKQEDAQAEAADRSSELAEEMSWGRAEMLAGKR
jgi:hypothetical protein